MQLYHGDDAYVDKNTVSHSSSVHLASQNMIFSPFYMQSLHHYYEELIGLSVSVRVTVYPHESDGVAVAVVNAP